MPLANPTAAADGWVAFEATMVIAMRYQALAAAALTGRPVVVLAERLASLRGLSTVDADGPPGGARLACRHRGRTG